ARYSQRSSAHLIKGNTAAAIADLSMAVQIEPTEAQVWANRGDAHATAKDIEKALADHAKAIELDPQNPVRWNNRGVLHEIHRRDYLAAI
ncbi:tetratricopeptide repeat protein, partial [Klebsiella pneumoniae]|nr:tetratricopeptide repeat protein [Klebsiella pneumoniae]